MKKRLSFFAVCIVVLALLFGTNTVGCGSANNASALPDETGNVADDDTPDNNPAASETPYDPYYWVSTEGSDDNPGTQEKPFRTLYKAATACYETAPKDIYIYPGTYEEAQALFLPPNVSIYGLGSRTIDPVKYRPVIDLRGCGSSYCTLFLVGSTASYNGGSDVSVDGLKIYAESLGISAYETALTLTNTDIIVSNNGNGHTTGVSVDSTYDAANIVMRDNTIRTEDTTIADSRSTAVSISTGGDIAIDIQDNTISAGQTDEYAMAVSLMNFNQSEQNVLIKGNAIASSNSGRMSGGIFSLYAHTLRIEQNTISVGSVQNQPGESEMTAGIYIYSGPTQLQTDATILNNAIFGGSGGDRARGIYIDTNVDALILFNTIDAGSGTGTEAAGIYSFEGASTRAHNNILCAGTSNNSYGIFELRGTMAELSHNLFCQDLDVFYETHPDEWFPHIYSDVSHINALGSDFSDNISGDPNFANVAAHDYHLVFPSAAADAGRMIAGVTQDLEGNARMKGQAPDIGAYELR